MKVEELGPRERLRKHLGSVTDTRKVPFLDIVVRVIYTSGRPRNARNARVFGRQCFDEHVRGDCHEL